MDESHHSRMHESTSSDVDQRAEIPTVAHDRRRRTRGVPDQPVNAENIRTLTDSPTHRLTCGLAGQLAAQTDLLSSHWVLAASGSRETGGRGSSGGHGAGVLARGVLPVRRREP